MVVLPARSCCLHQPLMGAPDQLLASLDDSSWSATASCWQLPGLHINTLWCVRRQHAMWDLVAGIVVWLFLRHPTSHSESLPCMLCSCQMCEVVHAAHLVRLVQTHPNCGGQMQPGCLPGCGMQPGCVPGCGRYQGFRTPPAPSKHCLRPCGSAGVQWAHAYT